MSNRLPQKPRKRCFFCGQTGNMSKEHAWPQWLGEGAEVEPTQTTRTIGYGRTAEHEMTEAPTLVVRKPGSVLAARVREVCSTCNNGWMSALEVSVQPLLERLWRPEYPLGRTTVSLAEADVVAAWAAKTAWVRERVSDPEITATPEMRRQLMDRRQPPEFTRVWIARHAGKTNFGVYVGRMEVTHQDDPWDTGRRRHVLICTLTFRGLTVLVRTDDGWGVPAMRPPNDQWHQFWPVSEAVQWPPVRPASDDDVQAIAMRYHWLRHPDVPIFRRDPHGVQAIHRN
jgi:hypothetical protein